MNYNNRWTGLIVAAALGFATMRSDAQTAANGPYYATPSWDQTMPASTRFVVLSNFNNEVFLDRETGLVWTRNPLPYLNRRDAVLACFNLQVGGRQGFRLPAMSELGTLVDLGNASAYPAGFVAGIPINSAAPFVNINYYGLALWTSNAFEPFQDGILYLTQAGKGAPSGGFYFSSTPGTQDGLYPSALCVRGPSGNSGNFE